VCFSFSTISSFLALFHVLQRTFLIFENFQFSLPFFTSYRVCFSFTTFSFILPYSRSYRVHLSFFMFFNISRHISLPKECYSHFPWFSVLLSIFQVLQCAFFIFHVFQWFRHF
jgi:hypothetical protein